MDRKLTRNSTEKKKLNIRPRDVAAIDWPGQERRANIMMLNCAEIQQAHFAARNWFERKGQPVDDANERTFTDEENIQLVYRMLIEEDSVNPKAQIFSSADEARAFLGPDECAYFIGEHIRLQTERVTLWSKEG